MAQERTARPAKQAGIDQEGRETLPEPGVSPARDEEIPPSHSVNQVRDEPIPASHDDDGRPEPGEESAAPGTGPAPA
jgi:hypothetical protein